MKTIRLSAIAILSAIIMLVAPSISSGQVKRTSYKNDSIDFGAGGTVTVTGAPSGSIRIEGWNKNEIEVSAEIRLEAPTESDADKLAEVSGFLFDPTFNNLRITSVGAYDKGYLKRSGKKLPKNLIGTPVRIDYVIKVPKFCDLNIDGGDGDFAVTGVDGNMRINFIKGDAKMALDGGAIQAIFGAGNVEVTIPTRSWRGRFADIQLTSGNMKVLLPAGLNAQFDAAILRGGAITNSFSELKPRTRNDKFTEKAMVAKAGVGGVPLKFTVGEGNMSIDTVK